MSSDSIASLFAPAPVLTPADGEKYKTAIRRWAENAERPAKYVVLPRNASEVSHAIQNAIANNLEIAIKGGGHSTSGASSSNDVVLDLGQLSSVSINTERSLITVGGGALWGAVDEEAAKYGLATVGGTVNHTGVGGLTVGGGYGWLSAKYGLAIDVLIEAEVVVANGEILTCNSSQNEDLFWAIRGGGSNFGVVTTFVFQAFPQTNPVWAGLLVFPPTRFDEVFKAVKLWTQSAGENESGALVFACPPPMFEPALVLFTFFNGSAQEGKEKFSAFYNAGPVADMTQEISYAAVNGLLNPVATHGDRKSFKAGVFTSSEPTPFRHIFDEYVKLTQELPEAKGSLVLLEYHPFEKIASVPTSSAAFANRGRWYNISCSMRWKSAQLDQRLRAWSVEQVEYIRSEERKNSTGADTKNGYANYDLGDERIRDVFGDNYERLQQLKAKYDPGNIFHKWFPITPKAA